MHPFPLAQIPVSDDAEALRAALQAERAARIRAEEALRHAAGVEELARLGSWEESLDGGHAGAWSAGLLRVHGLDKAPASFEELLETVHPDDRQGLAHARERLLEEEEPFRIVYRVIPAEGEVCWVEGRARVVRDGAGKRIVGTCQDVTERHLAEHALRERDRMLDEVEELAQLGTWEWNLSTDEIRWSPEQLRIHGMTEGAGTQTFAEFLSRVHPDDQGRVMQECERLIATGESFTFPYRVVRPDGTLREMQAMGKLLPDATGQQVRMVGTAQDVTERNRADRALRASEARFRDLFEQFPHSVQILSPEGRTLQVNPAFDRLWGLPMEELAGYNPLEDPRMEPIRDLLRRGFAGERVTLPEVEFDTRGMHAEVGGQPWPRWIRSFVFAVRDDAGAVREVVLVHEDVTEQRRAEEALRTSEESYRTIFDSSSDAIFVSDPATGAVVDANRAACTMADATIEELRTDAGAVIWNGPAPYTAERAQETMRLAAEGVPQRFEWLSIHPRTGAEIWGEVSLQRVTLDGELRILALVRDIGERKRAEQALRASEQSYRALFELSNDPIYVHEVETGAILDANRKACEAAGLDSVEEIREQGMALIAGGEPPFTTERALEYVKQAAAGEPQRFEWRNDLADGRQIWSEISLNRVTIGGEDRLLATARDITERKRAEQALRDSERSYRTIFDWTAAALWVHDLETGEFLDVNQTACALHGYTPEEIKALGVAGLSWGEPPYTVENAMQYLKRAVAGEPQRFEWLGKHKDGSPVWAEITLRRVTINGEDRLLATGRNTNEWKAAERALRASEESYRTIFDSTAAAIWVHDLATGELREVNQAACELYGYTADEQKEIGLDGLTWGEAPYTTDELHRIFGLARAGEPQRFVWLGRHKEGGEVWAEVQARRVSGADGDRLLVTARGMNEWRAAADALRRANEELEQRVAARTAELAQTNIALEEEVAEHESAREELLERTRELEGVFQALPDLYFRIDPNGVITDHRAGRAAGIYSPLPDFRGRRMQDVLPAEPASRFAGALEEVGRTGELACVEYALEMDGAMHDFEARLVPLADGSRITVVRDITERKAAEAEINRQKAYFEEVIGSLENGIAVFDTSFRFEYSSPSTVVDPEVRAWIIGRTILEYAERIGLPPEMARRRHDAVVQAANERASVQFEEENVRPDGTKRHMLRRALPVLNAQGELMRIIGYSVDITERKRAEEALQEREERFRTLIEHAHDIITILDGEGKMVYQSPSTKRVLGYTPAELEGISAFSLVHPDDVATVQEAMGAIVGAPGTLASAEYRFRHKDGSWRRLETFGRALPPDSREGAAIFNSRDVTERHEAERALQEREEHFRRMIENASDMVQVVAADTRIVYTGPSVERLLGYTPEEIQGSSAMDYLHPDDIPATVEKFGEMLSSPGVPITAEYRVRHKDGRWRDFEAQAMTLASHSAEEGVVVNARDVTERRRVQEVLQRSEEHFRALIENAHDLTVIVDASGRFVYQSPSMERIYGRSRNETLGHTPWELMHPDDVAAVKAEFARILANPGSIGHVEYRYRHADGSWVYTEAFGRTLDPESAEQGVVVNARDVTERRLAESEIRDQEERLRFALEAGRMGAWEWDVATDRVTWSPTLEEIHMMAPGSFAGTREAAIADIHPEDRARLEASLHAAVTTGQKYEIQYRSILPDGSICWLETNGRVMEDAEGRPVRMVGVCRDITERMRAEEALRRATEDAERANRAKSEFLSRMSHELRTPMNSILGFAQVLSRAGLSSSHNKYLQHILKGGRHLLNLINEVLEISRIESGKQTLSLEPVHLATVLQEALGLVRPLAEQRRVELDDAPYVADPGAYVHADRQRLTQVVLNLLSNAVKYNRPGGRVRLWSDAAPGEECVRIRIEDTGPGIPADRADQLFTPFARLGAEQTEVEGTGLGLALSLRLAEAMGGDLVLESTGTGGSVFRLELRPAENPLTRAEESGGAPAATGVGPHRAARVLYIEDNLANLALVETFLMSRPEWQTIPALQGLVGVELAREHHPDLILLDLHLPDMHGSEVLRRLRADTRTSDIPVVVISADATRSAVDELLAAGADAYLTKPLDLDEFLRTLEQFLPEQPS
jgi:PAS domain S-box-containing protein